jgi:uncharacterized membrane protein
MSAADPSPAPPAPPAPPVPAGPGASPPETGAFSIPLRTLGFGDPLQWLAAGWRDFMRCPLIGLFYGACFVGMGWALVSVFQRAPAYVLALSAGFLLVGPFLALGLYQASYRLERGEKPALMDSAMIWRNRLSTMGVFGVVLLVLEMLWARASLVVFALSFDGMPDFKGSILALFDPKNTDFIIAWVIVGGIFAGLIFAVSVISIPMMLHRSSDAITAGLTSMRLVLTQPAVLLWWGALLTTLVVLAMLPGFAGLLVVGPVLGHASWHAYRTAVGGDPGIS